MAVAPIYYGSYSSLDRLKSSHKKKREEFAEFSDSEDEDEESEAVSAEDAYMFPVYGSAALFSMYVVFKYLNADWVNMLLSSYFALLGVAAVTQVGVRLVKSISGLKLPLYHVHLVHRHKTMAHVRFSNLHLAMVGVSALLTGFYMYTKNWLASNLFGLAFSFSAITLIRLDSFKSGMIMLAGLFVYDVFWVFGTEVMVSVAKNFDAPIKVVFPKQLFPDDGKLKFTMLGLGDIVVPGIFLALALRFDRHQYLAKLGYAKGKALPKELKGKHRGFGFPVPYFTACLAAYVAGLATTISVMHVFQAAQPALLYLSPACILAVLGTAAVRGEMKQVFAYAEESKEEEEEKK
ncbi:peptidase A22B, signal peptide peptidase, partial [Coemansia mojavensis]